MKTYESCRKAYPDFFYKACTVSDTPAELGVTYHFEIPGLSVFEPSWSFPKSASYSVEISGNRTLQSMLFGLGMVELISYWKIACPPRVVVYISRFMSRRSIVGMTVTSRFCGGKSFIIWDWENSFIPTELLQIRNILWSL